MTRWPRRTTQAPRTSPTSRPRGDAVLTPSVDVRRELERLLDQDQTRVGQVYRLERRGLSPDQIAKELGVSTSGFVSNARTMARGILEGHVPSGPAASQQVL